MAMSVCGVVASVSIRALVRGLGVWVNQCTQAHGFMSFHDCIRNQVYGMVRDSGLADGCVSCSRLI